MKFKIFNDIIDFDWQLLLLHLIYFALLLWVYSSFIVVIYSYGNLKDALNINKTLIAPIVITITFCFLRNNGLPSYYFFNIILALLITPSLVVFSGSNLPFSFIAVLWLAFAVVVLVSQHIKIPRVSIKHINIKILLRTLVVLSLLLIACMLALGGAKYMNFNLLKVYDFRGAATDNLPGIFGYFVQSFSKVVVPIGIILSLIYRKWLSLLLFIFCAVMIFALSGHKTPLFIPIVTVFVYWFLRFKNGLKLTILALIVLIAIGGLDFFLEQKGAGGISGLFGSLFVRRAIIVPSFLNWVYYDFFSYNPQSFWSGSKISFGLVDRVYDVSVTNVIGERYLGKEGLSANVGWIGSGMAQAGYFGIAIYSVLIGLILSFVDSYSKKLGYSFVISIFIITFITMILSADLITMMLTHGLLIFLLLIIFLPRRIFRVTAFGFFWNGS